jgi:cytochrome c551/c552
MKLCPALARTLFAACAVAQSEDEFDRAYRLAGRKGRFDCHALGYDYVGASFRAIDQRYRLEPQSRMQLADVIRAASRGHWTERFDLWPQLHFTPDELTRLVNWVLMQ